MTRQGWRMDGAVAALILLGYAANGWADDPRPQRLNRPAAEAAGLEPPPRKPTPLEDDAPLHDVRFQGTRLGWAVGDHGVIWHTSDGGRQWDLQTSGVTCSLLSVCFLTDKLGWAAGGGTMPFTRLSYGVLLKTTDGGRRWEVVVGSPVASLKDSERERGGEGERQGAEGGDQRSEVRGQRSAGENERGDADGSNGPSSPPLAKGGKPTASAVHLPRITRVKFFSSDEGIAVGQGSAGEPSGVFVTEDGGASWHGLAGQASPGWLAADFLNSEAGVVAGPRGRVALVHGQQVASPRVGSLGARGLRAVALQRPRSGWLVGDGGLALKTENAGLVWKSPPSPLPEGVRDTFDFRAVCCRENQVWIAGEPGSVIWHSPDGGESWEKQMTGQAVPITAVHFSSETCGVAVGALGMILRTDNAGRTWEPVRGEGRRVALMFLQGSQPQVTLQPIVRTSGEDGYRSLISVVAGEEPASGVAGATDFAVRMSEAMTLAGGSAAHVNWQFLLGIPGLDRDSEKLIAEWNRRTEGRLEEILIGGLVRQLRTWRPSVVVLERPGKTDALTCFINQAAEKAIHLAQDATQFVPHRELAALEPWRVDKTFEHLPPGSTGHVHVDPHQYLPRLGETVHNAAAPAESLLFEQTASGAEREAYRLLHTRWDEKQKPSLSDGFFAGLSLGQGSEARRRLTTIDDREFETRKKLAQRQRDFAAITQRSLSDPRQANQLIAQLPGIVRGMPAAQAALQLAELADRYHQHGQWELAELTMVELVQKYPDEPPALKAMQRLIQYWASGEITWRRLKKSASQQRREHNDASQVGDAIVQVQALFQEQAREEDKSIFDLETAQPQGVSTVAAPAAAKRIGQGYKYYRDLEGKVRASQMQAVALARKLEQLSPQLAAAPEVQFPLAAIYRQRAAFARSDEIYRRFVQRGAKGLWSQPAEAEMWLSRPVAPLEGPIVEARNSGQRPLLDGVLSDGCWQNAVEIRLKSEDEGSAVGQSSLAMICHDGEYLYLAATLARVADVRTDGPVKERAYDADLDEFDRVTLLLDVDRDRATYYSFSIDQRGCTTESCWHDRTWNPEGWLVQVDSDEDHWRFEAAIPLAELTPAPPARGEAWGVGIVRTVPAVGRQGWPRPTGAIPRPETFGLLRFD